MPAILAEADAIILTGGIDESIENNFNVSQLTEEKEKISFLETNPTMEDILFELEDHFLLNGQIGIIGFPRADDIGSIVSIHIKLAAPVTKRGG